jgi:DNA-3-methyladenine glycosylase
MPVEMKFSENGTISNPKFHIDQMNPGVRLRREFFIRDVLDVAPELPGKSLVVGLPHGQYRKFQVTEVEAYRGSDDKACHACKGRTPRTEVMFHEGGRLYIYLIYGMYWMLNIVTGRENDPQAVLIRSLENYQGPGRLTKSIGIDKSFYGEDLVSSEKIWIEDAGIRPVIKTGARIGIDYAGDYWKTRPWRYYI